jgi:hypothetical protein
MRAGTVRDPLHHDEAGEERLAADPPIRALLTRLQWLKLATGGLALALIAAIWLVWRWG